MAAARFFDLWRNFQGLAFAAATSLGILSASAQAAPTFADQQTFAVGSGPHAIAAADLNADGKIDLVVVNQYGYTISVLLNTTAQGAVYDPDKSSPLSHTCRSASQRPSSPGRETPPGIIAC